MSKKKKILLSIMCVLVFICVVFTLSQKNNVTAVVNSIAYSSDDIEKKIDNNKKKLENTLREYAPSITRDFTLEEEEKIRSGELTEEEAVEKLKYIDKNINISAKHVKSQEDTEKQNDKDIDKDIKMQDDQQKQNSGESDEIIGEHVSQMYSLKARYIRQLGILENQIINDYLSLPKDEQNFSSKQKLITKYMGQAASLENQCDSQVEQVLSSLKDKLNENNSDDSIINIIRESYSKEKSLKKAYYLKKLND